MPRSAFSRLARRGDQMLSRAAFTAAAAITAQRHGVTVLAVVSPPSPRDQAAVALATRGLADGAAARAAAARHEALYLAATVLNRPTKSLARAAGLDPKAVRKALAKVEERRDEPTYDRALDEIQLSLMEAV